PDENMTTGSTATVGGGGVVPVLPLYGVVLNTPCDPNPDETKSTTIPSGSCKGAVDERVGCRRTWNSTPFAKPDGTFVGVVRDVGQRTQGFIAEGSVGGIAWPAFGSGTPVVVDCEARTNVAP